MPSKQRAKELPKKRRRGTAEPRWGWSGVAPLAAAQSSARDIDLEIGLPGHQSSIEGIVLALGDLGAKYHRYLHQDEFGPTRAERMAALRLLLDQFDLLVARLNRLPEHLRLQLSKQLALTTIPAEPDIDNFQAYRHDETAVQQIGEAAIDVEHLLHTASATRDAEVMADLSTAAQRTVELLCALDTTTAGTVAIDSECPALEKGADADIDLIGLAIVSARVQRLRHRVELTLARLERQRGPERRESLRWLIWRLCDLYQDQTGRQATSSAVVDYFYKGEPQSPAGRFVLAAVAALQPPEIWLQDPDHRGARRLARRGGLERPVYFAMREYVAHHPYPGRRGRKRAE